MQRRICKEDVSEYSTEELSDDIDTEQDEEVLYRGGPVPIRTAGTVFRQHHSSSSELLH